MKRNNTGVEKYLVTLDCVYRGGTTNHEQHNSNPDYWGILLKDIKGNYDNRVGLDFGCGKGRNVTNMLTLSDWKHVDGIDISTGNIQYCKDVYKDQPSAFYANSGKDLQPLLSNTYDFVMSTIVFQHICVHELRMSLMRDIYRVMKSGGIFSFQMGYGDMNFKGDAVPHEYYANNYDAANSNGTFDVRVTDEEFLRKDLEEIGFRDIEFSITNSWEDGGHLQWIYTRCKK